MTFLEEVRKTAGKKIIYTEHALDEMNAEEETRKRRKNR